jgi:Ala-tRNA(Pro) deacylase
MPAQTLKNILDQNKIKYVSISHSPAYTAQEIAQSAAVRGKDLAKTVIVKLDGEMAMAVLPASHRVDFGALQKAAGTKSAEIASEDEFTSRFANCEAGAMPPFGNLYGMRVFVSPALAEDDEIAFNAGSHTELIRMAYADFARLVTPRVVQFSMAR